MSAGTNWAGNLAYSASRLLQPGSVEELQEIVAAGTRLRALGTRHSFNDLADTPGDLIGLAGMPQAINIDPAESTVTVSAGVSYGTLAVELERSGYALANLASLPHISVAGAIATGTHGSGAANRSLAAQVTGLEFVDGTGSIRDLSRGDTGFEGAVVALGALGVVTSVRLTVEPSFRVTQHVFENLPLADALTHFDEIMDSHYSVSMFTTWQHPVIEQVWLKRREPGSLPGDRMFAARAATRDLHPLPSMSAVNCTPQLGVPGSWSDRLPHFRMEFTPSAGEELQSEYLVPRRHAVQALEALSRLADRIHPLLQICELRTVARDDLWLSPAFGEDVLGIHFTWLPDQPAVEALLPVLEASLEPFAARPHWAKLFTVDRARLRGLYDRLPSFLELAARYDPRGVFRNAYLDRLIFGG
ncbi:MAG: D-arabinono-1,4-lactone oxidase [Microbacteriaceae bacterium]